MQKPSPKPKRVLPSDKLFWVGSVIFYCTAVPIMLYVDHPFLFAVGCLCSFAIFLFCFIIAFFIKYFNMDDQLERDYERYRKEMEKKLKEKEQKNKDEE